MFPCYTYFSIFHIQTFLHGKNGSLFSSAYTVFYLSRKCSSKCLSGSCWFFIKEFECNLGIKCSGAFSSHWMFTQTVGPITFPRQIAELLNTHECYATLIRELLINLCQYVGQKPIKNLWLEYMIKEPLNAPFKKRRGKGRQICWIILFCTLQEVFLVTLILQHYQNYNFLKNGLADKKYIHFQVNTLLVTMASLKYHCSRSSPGFYCFLP